MWEEAYLNASQLSANPCGSGLAREGGVSVTASATALTLSQASPLPHLIFMAVNIAFALTERHWGFSPSHRGLGGVRLIGGVCLHEGRMLGRQCRHPPDAWVCRQGHLETLGRVQLRDQKRIGQARLFAKAKPGVANQLLHRAQALADPMPDPLQQLRLVVPPLAQQVLGAGLCNGWISQAMIDATARS